MFAVSKGTDAFEVWLAVLAGSMTAEVVGVGSEADLAVLFLKCEIRIVSIRDASGILLGQ